nr:MAG: ORF1 [Torque teno midi virus]
MPYWWKRRNKPWFGRYRRFRRNNYYKPKRRRRVRVYRRRRTKKLNRRRRRRRFKVRRKQQKIILKQWQPECIKKCKIKGLGTIVLGAEGTQYRCYTDYKYEWTNPKTPAGGGFGCELFTLKYLYSEYQAKNNIWTASNKYKDLCRYTGCRFTFYRHPHTDFVLAYDIQPPFTITKYTYMFLHPQLMLLRRHKKILLSTATKPNGRLTKKLKIKPPKQLVTKWMFQEDFAKYGLVAIAASACNFRYAWLGCCNENLIITLYYLQPGFYKNTEWAQFQSKGYNPGNIGTTQMATNNKYYYYKGNTSQIYTMNPSDVNTYDDSVSLTGWFRTEVLSAYKVQTNAGAELGMTPCGVIRYNPALDTGKNSKLWVVSVIAGHWKYPKQDDLIMEGYPLWLMLYGYTSFLKQVKGDIAPFSSSMIVVQSDAIKRVRGLDTTGFYPILDFNFIQGKSPGGNTPILINNHWYPTLYAQRESISQIINCGPYIPKYNENKESTWQCNYHYTFYFKWGGTYPPGPEAENPETKGTYPVPDKQQEAIQIDDPIKQKHQQIFKSWDYRRGSITKTAIKRMQENLSTDDSLSTDSTGCSSPKKKRMLPTLQDPKKENKEIQKALHSLYEESTCQEPQTSTDLFQLIQHQHHQQQQLKHSLLTLVADLKSKQRNLLHQAGYLA